MEVIKEVQLNEYDTGSIEVQVALLTERINKLKEHFKVHAKDFGSKRGLQLLVGQRRRFLDYINEHDEEKYKKLIEHLGYVNS